jgi:hypothetical protein
VSKLPPGTQFEMRTCHYCKALFAPKRKHQQFCNTSCRSGFHFDRGLEGGVAGVTRLMRGRVSVVIHVDAGPAAEHAIALMRGDVVRVVKQ